MSSAKPSVSRTAATSDGSKSRHELEEVRVRKAKDAQEEKGPGWLDLEQCPRRTP